MTQQINISPLLIIVFQLTKAMVQFNMWSWAIPGRIDLKDMLGYSIHDREKRSDSKWQLGTAPLPTAPYMV
jgi:hypothetical protein